MHAVMLTDDMRAALFAAPAATRRCGHIPADPEEDVARTDDLQAYLSQVVEGLGDRRHAAPLPLGRQRAAAEASGAGPPYRRPTGLRLLPPCPRRPPHTVPLAAAS